jgi:hypothetical protein
LTISSPMQSYKKLTFLFKAVCKYSATGLIE